MYEGAEKWGKEFRKVHLRIFAEDSEPWVCQQVGINEGTCEIAADDVCQPTGAEFAGGGGGMVKIAPCERSHENHEIKKNTSQDSVYTKEKSQGNCGR